MMKNGRLYYVWNTVLMLCVLPFLLLAFYAYPSIHDDYLGANSILKTGYVEYIKTNYFHWTGRYTELVLKSFLSPLIYRECFLAENLLTLAIIVAVFLATYILCRVVIGKHNSLQIALILLIIFLCGLTNISSFFYWSGGYTAYTLGVVFSMLFFAFLYRLRKNNSFSDLVACSILVILACGSYEVVMIAMLWVVLTNVLYSKVREQGLAYSLVLCIIGVVSAGFSIFAPGNSARVSGINPEAASMSFFRIIVSGFKSVFFAAESIVDWLDSVFLFFGVILLFQELYKTGQIKILKTTINPLLISLWVFLGICASIIPSVVAYQAVWIHTWQCVYFFFLAGWLIICNAIFFYLNGRYDVQSFLLNVKAVWLARIGFVMIAFLSSSNNVHVAYKDLLYAPEYKRRVEARIDKMKQAAKENKVAELNPLFSNSEKYMVPQTLYTVEYNDDDAQAFAAYYGVDSVVVNRCHLQ